MKWYWIVGIAFAAFVLGCILQMMMDMESNGAGDTIIDTDTSEAATDDEVGGAADVALAMRRGNIWHASIGPVTITGTREFVTNALARLRRQGEIGRGQKIAVTRGAPALLKGTKHYRSLKEMDEDKDYDSKIAHSVSVGGGTFSGSCRFVKKMIEKYL